MASGQATRKTVFEVQREQRWRIWLLFALLLVLVYAAVWVACLVVALSVFIVIPTRRSSRSSSTGATPA